MHMAKQDQVCAILVKSLFECFLTCETLVASASSRIPWPVSCHDYPRCDTAINTGEVGIEELELLTFGSERTNIKVVGSVLVGCIMEIRFCIDHDY